MDKEYFVKKVKYLCLQKGIKPTNACKESGVGVSFLNGVERGASPTIANIEKLAAYLGTTVSDLIGETPPDAPKFPDHPYLVLRYDKLSKAAQQEVMAFIEFKAMQEVEPVEGSIPMEELGDTRPAGAKELEAHRKKKENS